MSERVYAAIAQAIARHCPEAEHASRIIHAAAELAFEEHQSSAFLIRRLEEAGFDLQTPLAGMPTAFKAEYGAGTPRIAVLLEYDALPELGHGCGHNLIAAGGLLASLAIREVMEVQGVTGSLVVIGTPAEEGGGGKILELEAGVFDDIDTAMMFHPSDRTILDRRMYACLHYGFRFHGIAAHAAKNPDQGRSALAAAIQFFTAIDSLRQYAGDNARLHGIIANGGTAPNVIPELSEVKFVVRDTTLERAEALAERVKVCANGAAISTGTKVEISQSSLPYAHLQSNQVMVNRLRTHLQALAWEIEEARPDDKTGSTDAGNVSLALPTIHPFIQVAPRGTASHSRALAEAATSSQAHQAMTVVAEALANLGLDLLTSPELLAATKDEFRTYTSSPLPA
ncbi:M20 family metallopeptidase [Nesterenkonia ebinurensis]|uniref:M20 family metallopeptidase n=1 Tax=Nesterenkonia ebinurensis TaxID=2608252 RepID=UPI00123D69A1|nr:M20 family metallopeptidase [Nesterenkonia ebinurensis]